MSAYTSTHDHFADILSEINTAVELQRVSAVHTSTHGHLFNTMVSAYESTLYIRMPGHRSIYLKYILVATIFWMFTNTRVQCMF